MGLDDFMAKKNIEGKRDVWQYNHKKIDFILKKSRPLLNKGMTRALEIGIGDGYLLNRLCTMNMKYTGIDISDYLITHHKANAKKKGLGVLLIQADISDIKKIDIDPQHVVFCIDILEHLNEKGFHKAIENIYNLIEENGIFVGSFPYNENIENGLVYCPNCGNIFHRVGHQHSINYSKLSSSMKGMFDIVAFGNVLEPIATFLKTHLKDLLLKKIRRYVPGGTVYFIAKKKL